VSTKRLDQTAKVPSRKKDGNAPSEDVRHERTRKRLARAVLSLASKRDISSASVSELSRRAGIYRTTFYAYAGTVVELLTKVLSSELDEVRRKYMIEQERTGQFLLDPARRSLSDIVDHVVKHEAVYGRASLTPVLRAVLAEHFQGSLSLAIRKGFVGRPSSRPEDTVVCSAFIAHGIAGGIEAWLHLPAPRDREALHTAIESMYPPWYFPTSNPRNRSAKNGRHAGSIAKPKRAKHRNVKRRTS
jgi:AcrR family transcriptional regulator